MGTIACSLETPVLVTGGGTGGGWRQPVVTTAVRRHMKISLFDHLFFKVEEIGMAPLPMGGAMILDPKAAGQKLTARDIADHLAARMEKIPLMRKKPLQDKLKIGSIRLVDDPEFDVENHVAITRIKAPGGYRELAQHLGRFSQQPIPTDRPLWQFEVIEGLRGGKIAVATHIHHGILDGVGAMESLAGLNDLAPCVPESPRREKWPAATVPGSARLVGDALLENLNRLYVATPKLVGRSAGAVLKAGASGILSSLAGRVAKEGESALPEVTVGDTSLNACGLSRERRVAWKALNIYRIRQISKRQGCTINDVALLLCSAALDSHYAARGESVDFDQVAVMPFNIRSQEDGTAGNAVTVRPVNLHNSVNDLSERLRAIAVDTKLLKQAVRPAVKGSVDGKALMAVFSPFLLEAGLRLVDRLDLMNRIKMGNTMITNVPGAPVPLYVAGAAVESVIPMAPVVEGMALSCTIASTHSNLVVGFHGCAETVGSMEPLVAGVEEAYRALA